MIDVQRVGGFDWDDGNRNKNEKHNVQFFEIEQVFFNQPLVLLDDSSHSRSSEMRHHAFGSTDTGRLLQIAFTLSDGGTLIRPISARPMSRKERINYAKIVEADPEV